MTTAQPLRQSQERLLSLDAFRGLTIACMIMVNNPGTWAHVYQPLRHAEWNGLSPTDLIFPSFIFMVGVSIAFAFRKRLDAGQSPSTMRNKVIIRALKIFLVGMFLYMLAPILTNTFKQTWGEFDFLKYFTEDLRYTGVLHRIALVFLVCGLLFIYTKPRTQLTLCILFLVGYWLCMSYIPMPGRSVAQNTQIETAATSGAETGCNLWKSLDTVLRTPTVELRPGNNLAAWVDSKLLPGRPWVGPWNHRNWDERKEKEPNMQPWDPEGVLSTLPAISSGLIGIFAGLLLLGQWSQERKAIILFFSGALLMAGGYAWGLIHPINKSLWTSSYVLFSSGFACTVLASCYYYMDILGRKRLLHFAVILGCNAIAIYCLADVLSMFMYGNHFGFFGQGDDLGLNHRVMNWLMGNVPGCTMEFASMAYALLFVCANFVVAWVLYILKIFIRL
jgi:predicted acyltransferase